MADPIKSLKEDIQKFEIRAKELENVLMLFGIELSELPDNCQTILNQYADIKSETKLHDMDILNLKVTYATQSRQQIEDSRVLKELINKIKPLESEITKDNIEITELENFASSIKNQEEIEENITIIEKKIEGIQKQNVNNPKDFSIDDLIAKVEKLEKLKNKE